MENWSIKYTPEFTEDIYNYLIKWCEKEVGKPPKGWRTWTDESYSTFKEHKYFNYDGDEDVIYKCGVDNNTQDYPEINLEQLCKIIGYNQLNTYGYKQLTTYGYNQLNTYGLEIGDRILQDILDKWVSVDDNLHCNGKWKKQCVSMFMGDRTILYFKEVNGHVGIHVSGCGDGLYIKAEGLKEFINKYINKKEITELKYPDVIHIETEEEYEKLSRKYKNINLTKYSPIWKYYLIGGGASKNISDYSHSDYTIYEMYQISFKEEANKEQVFKKEEKWVPKIGDWVVVLPEDAFYYNSEQDKAQKLINIDENSDLPYHLLFPDGSTNFYAKIRRALQDDGCYLNHKLPGSGEDYDLDVFKKEEKWVPKIGDWAYYGDQFLGTSGTISTPSSVSFTYPSFPSDCYSPIKVESNLITINVPIKNKIYIGKIEKEVKINVKQFQTIKLN